MSLVSADYRNGAIQPLPTDEETTKAVGRHVANFMLELCPTVDGLALENINRLKESKTYTFQDMYFLATVIKDIKSKIKLVDDDKLKKDNYILVAKCIKAAIFLLPKSKRYKAAELKGMGASANQVFQSLGAWEAIEKNPESSKHQVKRSRLEQDRIHRLLRKSSPEVDVFCTSCMTISKMAWEAIHRYGLTVIAAEYPEV